MNALNGAFLVTYFGFWLVSFSNIVK